jgi:hypothetical protein
MERSVMRAVVATIGLSLGFRIAYAGDYMFQISNDPSAPCGKGQPPPNPRWTIRSGPEVAADLTRYFGGQSESSALVKIYPNGHFRFCGQAERSAVYEALLDAASSPDLRHEKQLLAMVPYLASRQFVSAMDRRLANTDATSLSKKRIRQMRADAAESLRRMTTR